MGHSIRTINVYKCENKKCAHTEETDSVGKSPEGWYRLDLEITISGQWHGSSRNMTFCCGNCLSEWIESLKNG